MRAVLSLEGSGACSFKKVVAMSWHVLFPVEGSKDSLYLMSA